MCRNNDTEYIHVTLPYTVVLLVFKSIAMIGLAELSMHHLNSGRRQYTALIDSKYNNNNNKNNNNNNNNNNNSNTDLITPCAESLLSPFVEQDTITVIPLNVKIISGGIAIISVTFLFQVTLEFV